MDDDDDDAVFEEKPCISRLSRKVGEKLRRDRLNSLITQLAEEIPIIKYAHRRLDKSAILRLAVSYMKLHLGLKRKKLGGSGTPDGGILNWIKKVTDDALLIITQSGTIIYVSLKIFDMLGFYQTDMVGHNIKQFLHPDDLNIFLSQFSAPTDVSLRSVFDRYTQAADGVRPENGQMLNKGHNSFCVRMLRAVRRKQTVEEAKEYDTVCVQANCEKSFDTENSVKSVDELWMIALLRPFSFEPVKDVEVKISEFMKNNEWATMHNLDSTIIASDHRASLFHGFMVSEIIGKTPYMLIHEDDLESVAISHQMIMKNHQTPSTLFRMNNKFDLALYVQSQSIIVIDQWTKKPKCIVSVNTVLSPEEGKHLLAVQKKKTQAYIMSQQKQKVEKSEPVKQEVKSDDSSDSMKGHSQGQCTLSKERFLQIKKTSGKSLNEIYEKYSQNFPELYVNNDSCSSFKKSVFSEKRSHDYMDSDSNSLESSNSNYTGETSNSNYTGSDTSSVSATEDEADSPKYRSPSLKDLLSNEKCLEKASSCIKMSDTLSKQQHLPVLKGVLKRNRKNEKGVSGVIRSTAMNLSEKTKGNGTSFVASGTVMPEHVKGQDHAAAGHSTGVQSPTVDSSGAGSATSSAEGTADLSVKPDVYSRFTSQLVSKHAMLKQTIDSQKSTLEILRDQLQKSHNNVILTSQQRQIHDSLIEKITEAENQVVVQGQLLGELEHEILKQ